MNYIFIKTIFLHFEMDESTELDIRVAALLIHTNAI